MAEPSFIIPIRICEKNDSVGDLILAAGPCGQHAARRYVHPDLCTTCAECDCCCNCQGLTPAVVAVPPRS